MFYYTDTYNALWIVVKLIVKTRLNNVLYTLYKAACTNIDERMTQKLDLQIIGPSSTEKEKVVML
ncbi:MAG: hypothetical protein H6567_04575 [Lewinellaceae bacterium]|nr:hypothetical protein [Lewinellaceae bacterium]